MHGVNRCFFAYIHGSIVLYCSKRPQARLIWVCAAYLSGGLGTGHQQVNFSVLSGREKLKNGPVCTTGHCLLLCCTSFPALWGGVKKAELFALFQSSLHILNQMVKWKIRRQSGRSQIRERLLSFREVIQASIAWANIYCCCKTAIPVSGISGAFSFSRIFSSR